MNARQLLKTFVFLPLLLAIQCEEDLEPQYAFSDYRVGISPQSNFSLNDTIWIQGRVTALALNLITNDSVFDIEPQTNTLGVFKLIEPTDLSNTVDAIDGFELVIDRGSTDRIPVCENADLIVFPELDDDGLSYSYCIGLIAITPGDFLIDSGVNGQLSNAERHEFIISNYPIENFPNQIGFNRCGSPSWRFLDQSDSEYYFSVN